MLLREFYQKPTLDVAQNLLGKKLVRQTLTQRYSAIIVETEAYIGETDSACHASKGKTPRTEVMFGEAGIAYIYFVYGMHFMFNIVTEEKDYPCAVLVRAVEPLENTSQMLLNRKSQLQQLTNGPAKLCQALEIDKNLNGTDLTLGHELWLEDHIEISSTQIVKRPRVGIDYAEKKDREALWRFYIRNNPNVSKK